MVLSYNKVLKERIEVEKLNREMYAVINELKYNYTIEDIIDKADDSNILLKKTEDLLEKLTEINLFDLETGEGIVIEVSNSNDDILGINVKLEGELNSNEYVIEEEFNKTRWMNEVK